MPGLPIVEADRGALSCSVAAPCSICIPFLHLIPQLFLKQSVSFVYVKTEARRDNKKLI